MTNYNDGKWHGWDGGECPVHHESVVECVWIRDRSPNHFERKAGNNIVWDDDCGQHVKIFRVTKQHKEPMTVYCAISRGDGSIIEVSESDTSLIAMGYTDIRKFVEVAE